MKRLKYIIYLNLFTLIKPHKNTSAYSNFGQEIVSQSELVKLC